MNTSLNELKEYIKNSQKVESPRKSQKVENPKKTLSKLQTIIKDQMNDASILNPIKKRSHKKYDDRYPNSLPKIPEEKSGGKKRTRKNKSNRRRTLRKK